MSKKNPGKTKKNQKEEIQKEEIQTSSNAPSASPSTALASSLDNLAFLDDLYEAVEQESEKMAETLFEFLIDATDQQILEGTIPEPKDPKIKNYVKSLNKLFRLSRSRKGLILINRRVVRELDKNTYLFCICLDGGNSLDVLCEIVNAENSARTPTVSPRKVSVKLMFPSSNSIDHNHPSKSLS